MKKFNKKILLLNGSILSLVGFFALTSCQSNEKKPNDPTNPGDVTTPGNGSGTTTPVDPNIFKKQLPSLQSVKEYVSGKSFDELFSVQGSFINSTNFKEQLTSKQFVDQVASNELTLTLKEAHSEDLYFVNAVNLEQDKVRVIFGYKNTEEFLNFEVDGFKQESNFIINQSPAPSQSQWGQYVNFTQKERYNKDMEQYDQGLERNTTLREMNIQTSEKQKFDQKANEVGVPTYDRSNRLGMTIPEYDTKGNFIGLNMQKKEAPKIYSWVDGYNKETFKNVGLARTITNEQYKTMALQTYQLKLTNWSVSIDEKERELAKEIMKNDDNLVNNLFDKIKDLNKRQELKDKLQRNITVAGVVDELISQAWKQIQSENSASDASKLYDEYIYYRQDLILEKMKNASGLSEKTKDNITKRVRETTNFRHLEPWYRSTTPHAGTAWIIDHEITSDGSYPKKFYFATNLHVIDTIDKENFQNFQLTVLSERTPSLYQKLQTIPMDDRYTSLDFNDSNKLALTRIFDGRDYLTKDPVDYLADKTFNKKEFIDFAVFEVDFSKTNFTEEQVRDITNNYADKNDQKISFVNYDYLNNYEKIDIPLALNKNQLEKLKEYDSLYVLGYPKTQSNGFFDFFLDRYEDEVLIANAKNTYSLWTNASYELYKKPGPTHDEVTKLNYEVGYGLSYALGYRTFTEKPGIVDQFLSAPLSGSGAYVSSDDGKEYVSMNLGYMPRRFAPGGGASGSSVRNQENKLVGIFHSVNSSSLTGIAAAFRSNGYDYKELYGTYNLPQYDVIYGGGKDQNVGKSYREAMLAKNPNLKTHLFPNGLSVVPEEFKFKNN